MKIDQLITQRFRELESKAETVAKTARVEGTYETKRVDAGKLQGWTTNVLSLLQRVFGEESIHYKNFYNLYLNFNTYEDNFIMFLEIFRAAKEDYECGYIFSVRGSIKAEDSVDILNQATELLANRYKDLACVLIGVSLEITLKELSVRYGIPLAKLEIMNIELCKKGIYNMGMQKQITAWAHMRNKAAHGEWGEYTDADVKDMNNGVTRFIAEYM